jgi:acyl-CoA thioesterase I
VGRVAVFGDSITWGAWDMELGGWVNRLRLRVDVPVVGREKRIVDLYNRGIGGDRVEHVMRRFPVEAAALEPDALVLAVGINDSSHGEIGTDLRVFEDSYEKLLDLMSDVTSNLVVVGLTNVNEAREHGFRNEHIAVYDEVVKSIADRRQLPHVDVFGMLTVNELEPDGLHPSAAGHEKLSRAVARVAFPLWGARVSLG